MSQPVPEPFNGGFVTSRHAALLQPGELQITDDCVYREMDNAIWAAPGRTALTYGAIGVTGDRKVKGIGHLSFDGNYVDQIVAYASNMLYSCDFTTITPSAGVNQMVEVGGQTAWRGSFSGTTLDCRITITGCTVSGTSITAAGTTNGTCFGNIRAGDTVTCSAGAVIPAGTTVQSITVGTYGVANSLVLSQPVTSGGSGVDVQFSNFPFMSKARGCAVKGNTLPLDGTAPVTLGSCVITAVSNESATGSGWYRTATISVTIGTISQCQFFAPGGTRFLLSNTGSEVFEFVQFGATKYLFWDGKNGLKALEWVSRTSLDATPVTSVLSIRPTGLRPVESSFSLEIVAGSGWSASKGTGLYWFLVTEIYSPLSDISAAMKDKEKRNQIIESVYLGVDSTATDPSLTKGLPKSIAITNTNTDTVKVTLPTTIANNGKDGYYATHWGIYVYGPSATRPNLASMRRGATCDINTKTITLSNTVVSQGPFYPTVIEQADNPEIGAGTPAFYNQQYLAGPFDGLDAESHISDGSPNACGAKCSTFKTAAGVAISTGAPYTGAAIVGMYVQIRGHADPSGSAGTKGGITFRITTPADTITTDWINGEYGQKEEGILYFGSGTDNFGRTWSAANIATMVVYIAHRNSGGKQHLKLDGISITLYYSYGSVNFDGPAYRVVSYTDQIGTSVSDPAKQLAPVSTTGDFFTGSLVLNDTSNVNLIRYSLPGDPEAFPAPYVLSFNTRKRDKVTLIRTLGTVLIVGMENSIKRVNYLPRETDTDLSSGIAHEDIATDHGIPGPACAVRFDMPGEGIVLAYVSTVGCFITNGIWSRPISLDINWPALVKVSALSTAVMRVYPKEKWLALYYCPAGATHSRNTRVIYFCYQADKIKEGLRLPAVGPMVCSAASACEASLNSTSYLLTGHETDGYIYVEDNGMSVPAGYQVTLTASATSLGDGKAAEGVDVSISPVIRTRKMFPGGLERDAREQRILLLYSPYGTITTVASCVVTAGSTTVTSSAGFGSIVKGMHVTGEGLDPDTIVLNVASSSSLTLSRIANTTGTVTLSFDTGTVGITVRGSGIREAVVGCDTQYSTTVVGDLLTVHNDNMRQGIELQIEKVPLTFDSNHDTLTRASLVTNMRLHQFTMLVDDGSLEQNRAG